MPNPAFTTIEHWKRHTHLLLQGLLQRLDELSVSDYPAETPNELIRFLQDFLEVIGDATDKTASEDQLRQLSLLIKKLAEFLDWLDNAHTGQTPRSLTKVLKHLIGGLSSGSRVIVRPQAQYNYSIFDLQKLLCSLVETYVPHSRQATFDEHLSTPLKLISFPRIERDNVLAHAIFGHELGHPLASEFLELEEQKEAYKVDQSAVQQKIVAFVDSIPAAAGADATKKFEYQTLVFKNVLQIRKRAMEELVSDAVGILIFGPSAFFAMFELLWGASWDAPPVQSEWYPPSRMRIRLMLRLMDDLKILDDLWLIKGEVNVGAYVDATRGFVEQARELVKDHSDEDAINGDMVLKIAYDWMNTSLADAIRFAQDRTGSMSFRVQPAVEQLSSLIRRLELGIPPNEVGDPKAPVTVDYRTSLLAAWMFKFRGISPKTGETLSSDEIGDLYMQTMRAIEFVILRTEYDEHAAAAAAAA